MISAQTQQALHQMVCRAVQASPLVVDGVVAEVTAEPDLSALPAEQVVVLTVSSYLFRLTFLIYFSPDAATYAHFASANNLVLDEMGEAEFADALRECANMCCGNLNRDLVRRIPHLGMSTPNILDRRCVDYLGKLGKGHQQHFVLRNPQGPHFGVSLCVNAFAPLDFVDDQAPAEETGELEMF
jgi:hypothetical protein